jgi:hypothetical protein
MIRTALLVSMAGFLAVACGGPHRGKVASLPKGPPKTAAAVAAGPTWDDVCPTNFNADPRKAKKSATKARPHLGSGKQHLDVALSTSMSDKPDQHVAEALAAVDEYRAALDENHYNAEATYQLAVSYALLHKRGCALAMLKRLHTLTDNARLSRDGDTDVETWLALVAKEPAFADFAVEAQAAAQ